MYEDRLYENAKEKYNSAAKVLTAAYVAKASDHGKTFFLNATTEFEVKLPAPSLGLAMSFIVKAAPSGANYTVVTHDMTGLIKGGIYTVDVNSATDPDLETSGGDTVTFVASVAVAGDRVDFVSDGTYWYVRGFCTVYNAITITGS
jgi:hypothetical protein